MKRLFKSEMNKTPDIVANNQLCSNQFRVYSSKKLLEKSTSKRLIFFLSLIILNTVTFAQTSKTVNVSSQGTLKNLISSTEAKTISVLTLSGNIDARDFAFLRDNMKVLSVLNLYSTSIKNYTGIDGTNTGINTSYPANEVPMYAFYNPHLFTYKSTLTSLTLPSGTVSIGYLAFYYAWNLSGTLSIPASLKSISNYAFSGCSSLTSFAVASSNTRYSSANGVLFNKSQDTLFIFPQGKTGNYTIPSSVIHIGASAFENCWNLTTVSLPASLKSIGSYAFSYCSGITGSLTLPTTLKKIEDGAFYGCWNLNGSVTIPATLTELGNYCFLESNNIKSFNVNTSNTKYASSNDILYSKNMDTLFICPAAKNGSVTIPSTVKLIGSHAFYKCSNLSGTITIPSLVDYIGYYSFYGCSLISGFEVNSSNQYFCSENGVLLSKNKDRLLSCPIQKTGSYVMPSTIKDIDPAAFAFCENITGNLNIPCDVKLIGEYAFYNTKQLTGFTVDASNTAYSAENGLLYNHNKDTLLICPYSKSGTIELPNTVTFIGNSAFDGCPYITKIIIPESTTSIGNYAFEYCTGLTRVKIPRSTVNIGIGAFYSCTNLLELSIANPNPPVLDYYTLDLVNKTSCNLKVPIGAKTSYQNAPYWNEFSIISEADFELTVPAVLNSPYVIYNSNNEIKISGTNSDNVIEVFDIQGHLIEQKNANFGITTIYMPTKGIYIVKINNYSLKVII